MPPCTHPISPGIIRGEAVHVILPKFSNFMEPAVKRYLQENTFKKILSYRGRERGQGGGRAVAESELLSPQLF